MIHGYIEPYSSSGLSIYLELVTLPRRKKMKCPACKGTGEQVVDHFEWGTEYEPCYACSGRGTQTIWWFIATWFWDTKLGIWIIEKEIDIEWKKNPLT
jgi:hypothetical protein